MCFKCVAKKMTEAQLLRTFEFAQNNIGLARSVGNDDGVKKFTIEMFITRMVYKNREREMLAQLNAGQSILMEYLEKKRKKHK